MGQHSSKQKIAILGSSGNVGKATLQYFSDHPVKGVKVTAFVRDKHSTKAGEVKSLPNITVAKGDMSDESALTSSLRGFDGAFIITPGDENRTSITQSAVRAASAAGVKHVLVVSVLTIDRLDQVFGSQFAPIEGLVKSSGMGYTLIRLPLFMDNNYSHLNSVRDQGEILSPMNPDAPFVSIALQDVAEASAAILANPSQHANRTYTLTSAPFTMNDMVRAFADSLGKEVRYTRIDYGTAKNAMLGLGMPEWQVDGSLQLMHSIDTKEPIMSTQTMDFKTVTGRDATTIQQWVTEAARTISASSSSQPQPS